MGNFADMKQKGKVYIIGAGPGDPGLLTVKAVRCIEKSDVIVYDYLVSPDILGYARVDARLVYVGKRGGHHTVPQDEINRILVREASEGNTVARLKGGDPFMFGRGGEEAEVLFEAGIPFEIIPGITSAIAVPAYAGIPLTHREHTSTVAFVTGHEDPKKDKSRIDWEKLSGIETLVFLMGVKNLPQIVASLLEKGRSPDTPAAIIRWGTTHDQVTLSGMLGNIADLAEEKKMTPPAIFVVGEVAKLRENLNWFERKPLFGRGIVITRPEKQAGELASLLSEEGAHIIHFPTIEIAPPETFDDLDRALANVEDYDWIIFTSANGVRFFFNRLNEMGKDVRDLKGIKICSIGPATKAAIEKRCIPVDIVPEEFISEGVVAALKGQDMHGARVLLPRAEVARDVIPEGLKKLGATVDVAVAYRTVSSGRDGKELEELIEEGKVDVITFTSPSTVNNFISIMGGNFNLPENIRIACIGPVTEKAAQKAGLRVDIVQGPYEIAGLVSAMKEWFENIQ
jgi:uroporphyrinogen III methyltransferase/synthase